MSFNGRAAKLLIIVPCLGLFLVSGCSGDSTATSSSPANSRRGPWKQVGSEVPVPHGPPPKKLVVRQLKQGSGPRLKTGEAVTVRYVNVDYRTAQVYEDKWDPAEAITFNFGAGQVLAAWETGMKGMRVGDRRELIVPKNLSYGEVPQIYVIELLAAKR